MYQFQYGSSAVADMLTDSCGLCERMPGHGRGQWAKFKQRISAEMGSAVLDDSNELNNNFFNLFGSPHGRAGTLFFRASNSEGGQRRTPRACARSESAHRRISATDLSPNGTVGYEISPGALNFPYRLAP